jgi:membrane protease YdiL (CAAX protease family)
MISALDARSATPASLTGPADNQGRPGGRRVLATICAGAAAAAAVGTALWLSLRWLTPSAGGPVVTQVIVVAVYLVLVTSLVISFRPVRQSPLNLRFTSGRDLGLACGAWLGFVALALAVHLVLSPLTGGVMGALRQIVRVATDAERLQGQPALAWLVAIPRGCLIVPVFEELLFRGVLPGWLRTHLSSSATLVAAAALFALMHGYPIAMPAAFVFGLVAGWVRQVTGSTLNTVVIHVLNNVAMLLSGLLLLT